MPTFEYQAQGHDGQVVNGMVVGTSMDQAMVDLRARGMQVLGIRLAMNPNDPLAGMAVPRPGQPGAQAGYAPRPVERPAAAQVTDDVPTDYLYATPAPQVPGKPAPPIEKRNYVVTSVSGPVFGKVGLTHLLFYFRQASTMFRAGVPIVQATHTLARQSRSPKLKRVLTEIAGHVEAGRPMSAGMQRYPEVFTPVMLSLVRAGEEGGFLDESLETVAQYLEREIALRNLYRRVTFYPKLQIGASIIIIVGANALISSLRPGAPGLSSPLTTISTWYWLAPLLLGIFLFLRVGLANPRVKYAWDIFVSCIPYIGNTFRQISMARFGRAFGALYKGGVPIPKAFQLAADSCGNEFLRARMYPAASRLETGAGVFETFKGTQAFSPIVLDMVQTGESTGNLDQMLHKVADFYEDEAETRSTQTGMMTGVLVGLLVAIYIGYIIIGFYQGMGDRTTEMINTSGDSVERDYSGE
jgi:type II secretory pathway component PulF